MSIRYNSLLQNTDLRVANEILQACQVNKNLTRLDITYFNFHSANLQNGGEDNIITPTLRRCTHLRQITLYECNITDEHFLPMVEAIRQQPSVEHLSLPANLIGSTGCQALATLLEDSNCNLHTLELQGNNNIGITGVKAIAQGLATNKQLRKLHLLNNPSRIKEIFCKLVCNTSSVNSTYLSNHTLERVEFRMDRGELKHLLECNQYLKEYAAVNKILRYHHNIDMEPFFEMGIEDSERNLKALPYIIDWFERAKEAVLDISFINNGVVKGRETFSNEDARIPLVDSRKLSSIYQFALTMPLLFVPADRTKTSIKKRKMGK